jgi:uncharacterized protein (TIGR03067 family)
MGFAQEKTDKDKVQGEWKIASFALGGKDVLPREFLEQAKVVFKGDTIVLDFGNKGKEEWGFKLDATKTPKAIDLFGSSVKGQEKKWLPGIYMIKDKELTLRWCTAPLDRKGERPTEFTKPHGSDFRTLVLKR